MLKQGKPAKQKKNSRTLRDITESKNRAYDIQFTINKLLQLSLEDIALDALLGHTLELILSLQWLAFESRGGIFLVEDEPDVLTMKVQKGLATPLLKECARIPFGRCLCGRAALLKEVQFADAVDGRHETSYEGIAPHGHYCVPILAGGTTLGVINVYLKEGHRRDPREEEFLAAIANTLAGILIRRRITDRLIEGEKRYQRLLESASGYTYTVKLENGHPVSTTHGPTCDLVTGFTPEDYAADPDLWYRMIHEDDRDAVIEQSSNLLSLKDALPVEHRIIHKDGSIRWVNNTITPHYDSLGHLTAYDGIVYNITARKTAEEELVKYKDHLEELIADRTAELKTANRELLQRQTEIMALLSASRALLELKRFDDIARSILDLCKKLIGATAGYVAFLSTDGTQNEVLFLDPGGLPCNVDPSLPMPMRGLREEAYRTGKTVYHNDFSRSAWAEYLPEGHVNIENALFAPLKTGEKTIGLLGLANKPGGFTEDDANLTGAFAELVVIAYLNNKTLESLANSEERFRSVVQTANVAIVNVDKYGKVSFWNKAAETIFGYSSYEVLGRPITLIIPEKLRNDHLKGFERNISTRESRVIGKTIETTGLKKDGSEFPVELSVSTWKTSEETFFTGIMHDITELKRAEKELLTAKEMAEAANRAKSDFLASMSHELRTPMNAIIGFSQVLQAKYYGELNEKQVEYITDILDSGNHLLSLINDILDLSKVEAGKMQLELSRVDITALLKNSLLMIQEKALRHGIIVELNIPASLEGLEMDGDERKLKQIMFNFLSNAAKFTPEGGRIGVSARLVGAQGTDGKAGTDEGTFIEICVSDTGIGIKAEDQERVFEPFVQVKGGTIDKTPGTGLGLTLTKDFVELHGGRIWVESEGLGKGSRFYVLLPVQAR